MGASIVDAAREASKAAMSVEGLVRAEELRALFLAAALPAAEGEILEIGGYKGRSTVALAQGALWAHKDRVVACDPFTYSTPTEPTAGRTFYGDFLATLQRFGLTSHVEVHKQRSSDLAKAWTRPIRLLWVDGDHTYEGVKADIEGFFPHLVPGAVVALHDVSTSCYHGPLVCFMEDVVLSDQFGACGMCWRIGWAQFVGSGGLAQHRRAKSKAYQLLAAARLARAFGTKPRGLTRLRYRLFRKGRSFEKWLLSSQASR